MIHAWCWSHACLLNKAGISGQTMPLACCWGRCSQPSKCPVLASGRPMTMSVRPSNNKHTHHPRARSDHEYTGDRFSYSTLPLITLAVVPVPPVSHPVALQNLYRIFYPTTNDPQYSLLRSAANPWEAAVCPLTP